MGDVYKEHHLGNRDARRRSVDVGGLALALAQEGLGHGWGGWDEEQVGEAQYAELLSDMYTHTHTHTTADSPDTAASPVNIPLEARIRLIRSLDNWNFEPHKLPDEEVVACTLILFESLYRTESMEKDVGVSLQQLSIFLHHLRLVYRWQNSYHNFHHALDVLQATHNFLYSAGIVPPVVILLDSDDRTWRPDKTIDPLVACLTNEDLFALYIAAIGHDAGHPGFTNNFMKNAKTPLSLVFDDKSALEQMHCALLLNLMRQHGIGHLLDRPVTGALFRNLLLQTVLATDMSVHFEFMKLFRGVLDDSEPDPRRRKVLLCQALIKCADISNPCRPMTVSRHWAAALMEEWTSQALLERHLSLEPSVQPSDDPLSEARSQVWFINTFAKPLFDIVASGIPQMTQFAQQCASNLRTWEVRCLELNGEESSPLRTNRSPTPARMPEDFLSAFPLTLPPCFLVSHFMQPAEKWRAVGKTLHDHSASDVSSETRSSDSRSSSPTRFIVHLASVPTVTCPPSPPITPSDYSTGSSTLSPQSEVFESSLHPQWTNPFATGSGSAAIRAAYKVSVRKKKSFHRNSWNPPSASSSLSSPVSAHPSSAYTESADNNSVPSTPLSPALSPSSITLNSVTHQAPLVARHRSADS